MNRFNRFLCFAAISSLAGTVVDDPARAASPCDGITPAQVRDIEERFPQTMGGRPAMPVAVSNLYVSGLNLTPMCAADMIVTFDGNIGYQFTFLIERAPDRLYLTPIGSRSMPQPIRLFH